MDAVALTEDRQANHGWKEKTEVSESAQVVSFGFYNIWSYARHSGSRSLVPPARIAP
jgi:hypothetical protein